MGCTYSADRKVQPSMAAARIQPMNENIMHSQQPIRINPHSYEKQEPKYVNNLRAKQSAHDIIDDYS